MTMGPQLLPEHLHDDRATRSIARVQETYAKDFVPLLRVDGTAKHKEQTTQGKRFHLLTRSARASTSDGIVRPICLAASPCSFRGGLRVEAFTVLALRPVG